MTKKDLEDIIQTAKAAGADVKVVQVGSAENEPVERPKIPLFKLEVGIKKEGDELKVMPTDDWCFLGSIFLEMAPIDIDIEKVKEMFTPAKNAFNHCCNELNNYIQEQYKGALEDEKERVADIEGSIMCMECKDHLDSDDYLQLGYLNQELASAKKDLENGNYELWGVFS